MDIITKNSKRPFYRFDSEMAAVLIELGLVDPLRPAPQQPAFPPKGWRIEAAPPHLGSEETKRLPEFVLVYCDGFGGRQVYVTEPAPTRRWVGPKDGEADGHHEMVPSDCPENILNEFRSLNGLGDPFQRQHAIEATLRRQARDEAQKQPSPFGYGRDIGKDTVQQG